MKKFAHSADYSAGMVLAYDSVIDVRQSQQNGADEKSLSTQISGDAFL